SATLLPPARLQYSEVGARTQASPRRTPPDLLTKAALQVGALPVARLHRCGPAGLLALENLARPADFDDGAAPRPLAIVEADGGAGALQERLGDEEAEPQARGFAVPRLTTRPH